MKNTKTKTPTKAPTKTPTKAVEETSSASAPVPDFHVIKGLATATVGPDDLTLQEIAGTVAELSRQRKVLETRLKDLQSYGTELLLKHHVKSVMVGELRVTQIDGCSSRLDKAKLIQYGVSTEVIEKATVKTEWTSLKVTEKKEKGEGGGGEE